MVKMPPPQLSTVLDLFKHYEVNAEDWRRDHLGASLIGDDCMRKLWYSFRWAAGEKKNGRILRLLKRGQREEEWIVEDLRAMGLQVHDRDESQHPDEDGEYPQYRFEDHAGHFGGGCDGVVLGLVEAPLTWHLLEVKTSNRKRFLPLLRKGVKEAMRVHWEQMQCYMHGLGLKRALYLCVCKDDDQIYKERVEYDREAALAIIHKAETVVFAEGPLSKISEKPDWYQCKMCQHHAICQDGKVEEIERNCRTCLSSTPLTVGGWYCERHEKEVTSAQQRDGCGDQLLIPALLEPWKPVQVSMEHRVVLYDTDGDGLISDEGPENGLVAQEVG